MELLDHGLRFLVLNVKLQQRQQYKVANCGNSAYSYNIEISAMTDAIP